MHVGEQNHNSGPMHDPTIYQQKTVTEIASVEGTERKISLKALWIGVKLHWIQVIQSWSMEGAIAVLTVSVQDICGKQKNRIRLPRLCFSYLLFAKTARSVTVLDHQEPCA